MWSPSDCCTTVNYLLWLPWFAWRQYLRRMDANRNRPSNIPVALVCPRTRHSLSNSFLRSLNFQFFSVKHFKSYDDNRHLPESSKDRRFAWSWRARRWRSSPARSSFSFSDNHASIFCRHALLRIWKNRRQSKTKNWISEQRGQFICVEFYPVGFVSSSWRNGLFSRSGDGEFGRSRSPEKSAFNRSPRRGCPRALRAQDRSENHYRRRITPDVPLYISHFTDSWI